MFCDPIHYLYALIPSYFDLHLFFKYNVINNNIWMLSEWIQSLNSYYRNNCIKINEKNEQNIQIIKTLEDILVTKHK
jgi:hypothetical protein